MKDSEWIQKYGNTIVRHNGVLLGTLRYDFNWDKIRFVPEQGRDFSSDDLRCISKILGDM